RSSMTSSKGSRDWSITRTRPSPTGQRVRYGTPEIFISRDGSTGMTDRSSAEIAAELHLSEGTVRNYLSEAINKLGAANRIEAARLARARGWL
ncbi:MAG: response regulator transcription factor, partial [Steroidobacteraceae bacterium]